MRNKLFYCFLILATFVFSYDFGVCADAAEPTPSENAVDQTALTKKFSVERYCNDLKDLKFEVSVYPKTISVGDVVCFHVKQTNVSEKPFWIFHEEHLAAANIAVLSSSASQKRPILTLDGRYSLGASTLNLRPGDTYAYSRCLSVYATPYWEEFKNIFPSAMNSDIAQFWKDVLQQVAEKGSVDCEVTLYAAPPRLMFEDHNIDLPLEGKFDDSVYSPIGGGAFTITSRSEKEMQALESLWRGFQGKASAAFKISGQTDDLTHYFSGVMSPRTCDLPNTVEGWRDLEERFSTSTLKDEITLIRLIVEYYASEREQTSDEAFAKIFEFIDSRPEAQRCAFLTTLQRATEYPDDRDVTSYRVKEKKLKSEAERVKGFERAF